MNMTPDNKTLPGDAEIIARAREIFRQACASTDSYHSLRLGLARRKALEAGARRSPARIWLPAAGGALAACTLALGVVWFHAGPAPAPAGNSANTVITGEADAGELPSDLDSQQMDLYQNLDFYRWLASQSGNPAPRPSGGTP